MIDDPPSLKTATIGRCESRLRAEYRLLPITFAADLSHQDAALFNILRACEAGLGMETAMTEPIGSLRPPTSLNIFSSIASPTPNKANDPK